MKVLVSIGAALAVLVSPLHVAAQVAKPAPKAAPQAASPSPRSVELARRYFAAMKMDQTMAPVLNMMMSAMIENELMKNPEIGKLQREALMESAHELLKEGLVIKMMDRMAPGFATVLTEGELEALVKFYESPEGQSVVDKMGALQKVGEGVGGAMAPEIGAELMQRACSKIECPKP